MKRAMLPLLMTVGGCTTAERNVVAVGLCERTAGCTVTRTPDDRGPPQVGIMEGRKPVSRTTEK